MFLPKNKKRLYLAALKTNPGELSRKLEQLCQQLEGELFYDDTMRILYATDASAYRELPLAVAIPKSNDDLKKLIEFARQEKISLIPRAAGTSLAGQVVGNGIVVDVSKGSGRCAVVR